MKSIKLILYSFIILPFLFTGCSKDNSTGPSKKDFFIYGLIGRAPAYGDPDSSRYWVYARAFSHPDHANLDAELAQAPNRALSQDERVIPLEAGYHDSDKYFTEGNNYLSCKTDEEYLFRASDQQNTYSGTITILPKLDITTATANANQITLEWTDINADFYDIEFWIPGLLQKHVQVQENRLTININEISQETFTRLYIDIGGFKGFSPFSNAGGNISGCHGYLFGLSKNDITLNIETMTFSKESRDVSPHHLDKLMLSLMNNTATLYETKEAANISFQFTYGRISNSSASQSGSNYFNSTTLVEPSNAVSIFNGYLDGILMDSYNWAGFVHHLEIDDVYDRYDTNSQHTFKLNVNDQFDSASVANPDTFSITNHPSLDALPTAPFNIEWRRPDNADFFLIYASWNLQGSASYQDFMYSTTNTNFTITDIPDSVSTLRIHVTAINGANPMHPMEPNMRRFNGYYCSSRDSKKYLRFSSNNLSKRSSENSISLEERIRQYNVRVDDYIIARLAEQYPALQKYKSQLHKHFEAKHLK